MFGSIYCIVRTTEQSLSSVHQVFVHINWKNYLNFVFQKTKRYLKTNKQIVPLICKTVDCKVSSSEF